MTSVLLATLVVPGLPNLYFAFQSICFKLPLNKGSSQIVPDHYRASARSRFPHKGRGL